MRGRLERILILSIWDEMWSLGEGCGVPDELHFIERLTDRGIRIDYLLPEHPAGKPLYEKAGFHSHTYPNIFRRYEGHPGALKRFLIPGMFTRTVYPRLENLIGELKPDLIIGYSYLSLRPVSRAGKAFGIPSMAKIFGVMYLGRRDLPRSRYWYYNYEQILALRNRVDHYLVLNDGTMGKEALIARGIEPDRITFLPNGMDKSWSNLEADREKARSELGLPQDKFLIVTFSRLVRSKRVDLFLIAASRIEKTLLERSAIVIGGDGTDREKLESLTAELGLSDKVHFTGPIRYEKIPELLKACDIFVGTNELTNMSMPPCEALLCGLPVVAFDVAGTSETIRDGINGLLVEDGDLDGLAAAIEKLITDRDLTAKLGEGALETARTDLMSWDERISNEIELFERLVSGPKPSSA